ncbi:hypothetical protein [Paludisphaera rhizosphaerae]|uniref:hypothetical protein n=1 Tax=Paludisphaera rhizosphaerae TaxID=2711216 RepID=UPI0013EA1F67|nr:hypothetical protein [Paludisphaera rhizosphaerae]
MERMEHIRGTLVDGEEVVLEGVDGYLASHENKAGRKTLYGYFEMPTERLRVLSHEHSYRLVLSDGRKGTIYTEVIPSNVPGNSIAEFHVSGVLKK